RTAGLTHWLPPPHEGRLRTGSPTREGRLAHWLPTREERLAHWLPTREGRLAHGSARAREGLRSLPRLRGRAGAGVRSCPAPRSDRHAPRRLRRRPHPDLPPQAGEGVQRARGERRNTTWVTRTSCRGPARTRG